MCTQLQHVNDHSHVVLQGHIKKSAIQELMILSEKVTLEATILNESFAGTFSAASLKAACDKNTIQKCTKRTAITLVIAESADNSMA
jgi:hypothetical protein